MTLDVVLRVPHVAPLDAARTAQRAVPTICVASLNGISILAVMHVPRRKRLPHEVPLWVDPQKEIYFITINCAARGSNQLVLPQLAEPLFETVEHRQQNESGLCTCQMWFLKMKGHSTF